MSAPEPTITRMQKEMAERAQDKQAAVAMRGQDLQVNVNKADLATRVVCAALEAGTTSDTVRAAEKVLTAFFEDTTPVTDPLAGVPSEVVVRA